MRYKFIVSFAKNYFMLIRFAKFTSYLLHPILIPTLLFSVLFFLTPCFIVWTSLLKLYLLGFIFLGTCCFPISITWFLWRFRHIESLEMNGQAERRKPFLITTIFYAAIALLLSYGTFQGTLISFVMISIALTVCLATFINLYHKISIHVVGICGSLGILFALQYYDYRYDLLVPILATIGLSGLVASSRLALSAHTPLEIATGSIVGFFGSFGIMTFALAS